MTTRVPIRYGGTGANSASAARTALGVPPLAAYDVANSASSTANAAYSQANTAYGQANSAFAAANNRVLKAGDTMTGQLNISSGGLLVTGNVGIGTTTPTAALEVGNSSFNGGHSISWGQSKRYEREIGVTRLSPNLVYFAWNTSGSSHPANEETFTGNLAPGYANTFISTFREGGVTRNLANFSLSTDNYTAEFYGYLFVETANTYFFNTNSDDASDLFIDGKRVADYYNNHGASNAGNKGSIYLNRGFHKFYGRFREVNGLDEMTTQWSTDGVTYTNIPATNFFHDPYDSMLSLNTGGVAFPAGNVGIRTTNPTSNLHVVGNANITLGINTATVNATTINAQSFITSTGANVYSTALTAYAQANAAYDAANNAKVTVYANNNSNVTTQNVNFVNTATVTVTVTANGSNANIAFTAAPQTVVNDTYTAAGNTAAAATANIANGLFAISTNAYAQANAAYGQANLAYTQANNARTDANAAANLVAIYANNTLVIADANVNFNNTATINVAVTGNTTTNRGNIEFTANSTALGIPAINSHLATINTTFGTVNTSLGTINAHLGTINTSFGTVNTSMGTINTHLGTINTTFGTVNTTFATLNTSAGTQNTSITNAHNQANTAYGQANAAYAQANLAYTAANNSNLLSGGSISGNLTISGNLVVQGNATTINVSNLSVNDSIILLGANATGDVADIGFIGHFDRGATATHAGIVRIHSRNEFQVFDNYELEPTNNIIDIANYNYRLGNVRFNTLNANSVLILGNSVATQANLTLAHNQANDAYTAANNRVLKAGDTMTGGLLFNFSNSNVDIRQQSTNIASIEMGGAGGSLIDMKSPFSDDYDFRIITIQGSTEFLSNNAAQVVAFSGANVNFDSGTLFVDSVSNEIGVGTTNPTSNLHVIGTANVTTSLVVGIGSSSVNANAIFTVGNTTANVATAVLTNFAGDSRFKLVAFNGNTATNASGSEAARFGLCYDLSNSTQFSSGFSFIRGTGAADGSLAILTNATERMRIDASGNTNFDSGTLFVDSINNRVGVGGLTAPLKELDVIGSIQSNTAVFTSASQIRLKTASTTSGYGVLHRHDGSDYYVLITNNNDADGAWNGLRPFSIQLSTGNINVGNASLTILHGATTSSGNVGVGTTSPGYKLDVSGQARATTSFLVGTGAGTQAGDDNLIRPTSTNAFLNIKGGAGRAKFVLGNDGVVISSGTTDQIAFHTNAAATTTGTERMRIDLNGNVSIGSTSTTYKLEVNGSFAATTKSFVINHPTKPGMKLRYGSLEGPENGVYVRGKLTGNIIELPDYWTGLVDSDSITVNLTPIGKYQKLFIEKIEDNKVYVASENWFGQINCYYTVFAERKDVEKLVVEY